MYPHLPPLHSSSSPSPNLTISLGNKTGAHRVWLPHGRPARLAPTPKPNWKDQEIKEKRINRKGINVCVSSYLVSSAISISGCAVMGVCEWPAGSSPPKSPLVDETTWTEPCRSAGVNVPPSRFPPGPPDVPAEAADAFTPSAQPVLAAPVGCWNETKQSPNKTNKQKEELRKGRDKTKHSSKEARNRRG